MESSVASSAMSLSLLARNVYCVCFADRDSLDILRGELAAARERYFTGGRKALRVGKREIVRGFEGKLQGKLSRRSFYWRKSAANVTGTGRLMLEEAFEQRGGYVLVNRDFRNVIASRVFFNKSLLWLKSEYYEPWDAHNPRVIFKPVDSDDQIERFDWDAVKKRYRSTLLYPVPYLEGTAEQSLLNARFGEPRLLVSTQEGVFCYCPRQEAQDRKKALEDLKTGTLVLLPAWGGKGRRPDWRGRAGRPGNHLLQPGGIRPHSGTENSPADRSPPPRPSRRQRRNFPQRRKSRRTARKSLWRKKRKSSRTLSSRPRRRLFRRRTWKFWRPPERPPRRNRLPLWTRRARPFCRRPETPPSSRRPRLPRRNRKALPPI